MKGVVTYVTSRKCLEKRGHMSFFTFSTNLVSKDSWQPSWTIRQNMYVAIKKNIYVEDDKSTDYITFVFPIHL